MRARVLILALLAGCKIEDGPPKPKIDADTIGRFADSAATPISDPSLRPTGMDADPATKVKPIPNAYAEALQSDSLRTLTEIDSSPAAQPTVADLASAKRELIVPVAGINASDLRDSYNERRGGGTRGHEALDIPAPRGTPVLSATGGRVLKLFNSKAGGLMVYATDSTERFILMYGHLDAYAPGLADGQALRQGQQIGVVGTTGNAPANTPHLHFAMARSTNVKEWWKGAPVNPYPLLTIP